jgi:hypothetical protein
LSTLLIDCIHLLLILNLHTLHCTKLFLIIHLLKSLGLKASLTPKIQDNINFIKKQSSFISL